MWIKLTKLDIEISKVAREKSKDMDINKYFEHKSPRYGLPKEMIGEFGYSYTYVCENIAKGQLTPESVMRAWMNSQ